MLFRWGLFWFCLIAFGALAACSASTVPLKTDHDGWHVREVLGVMDKVNVYEIIDLGTRALPTYQNCSANDQAKPSYNCSLDLLFVPSPDYTQESGDLFIEHIQAIMMNVFGSHNAMNQNARDADLDRPFRFFATNFLYPTNTPSAGACNPGLPSDWAPPPPERNMGDVDQPNWGCNIALSTAGVEIDLGFVIHQKQDPDRNRFNLFSSEYNSYATILHELSHAAFVMSDEAPNDDDSGRFFPHDYPNIYTGTEENACRAMCGQRCTDIKRMNHGVLTSNSSGFLRCSPPSGKSDDTNLMYFLGHHEPGNNANWSSYEYYNATEQRLEFIYERCQLAKC